MDITLLYRADGSDEEEEPLDQSPLSVEQELEKFRASWQEELRRQNPVWEAGSSGEGTVECNTEEPSTEEQAKFLFMQGVNSERVGKYSEAIQFYRRAVQLVPDIEFRVGEVKYRVPVKKKDRTISECSTDSNGLGEHEDPDDLSNLLTYFQKLKVNENGYCSAITSSTAGHISDLPVEVLQYIFKWVVSSDLDVLSLEYLSMVCRGFYICSRDEEIWRLICQRTWGMNCGDCTNYGTYRDMYYLRPHMRFTGCYISKTSYFRQGEESFSQYYTPFHTVEYFRFAHFFPDGYLQMLTSSEDPLQCVHKLRSRSSKESGLMTGYYRLAGNMVSAVLKLRKSEKTSAPERYRRKNRGFEYKAPDISFHVEFELCNSGRRRNSMLEWRKYSVITTDRNTGVKTSSDFDLNNKSFPPLIFSRVKSYTNNCDHVLH